MTSLVSFLKFLKVFDIDIQSPKNNETLQTIEQQQMKQRMGQTMKNVRQGVSSGDAQQPDSQLFYQNSSATRKSQAGKVTKNNNSSLGVKNSANSLSKTAALKISNMRIYNESSAFQKPKQASNNYTLRNNFISPQRGTSPMSKKGLMQSPINNLRERQD